jgi:ubiquinone/menaquinone biosynthesis C-methylase UbiE
MSSTGTSFNPEQFKAQQRQMWDGVAEGWQAWWETFELGAQKVSDKIIELAQVKPGDRVLDIATGIGEPAVTAASRISGNGKVVATDISPQMLAIARTRAKALGLDSIIEFIEGDAEALNLSEFGAAKFDAVLSRWGLMFLPNFSEALSRINRQLLAPNGRLSAAVWSTPSKVPLLDLAFATVRKQTNAPAPPPGTPGPFALADAEALKRSFSQSGFKNVQAEILQITFGFDSPESFTKFHQQITAPIQAMLANQTDERKKQVWNSVTEAVWPYADSHGRVNLDNEVICIVGNN